MLVLSRKIGEVIVIDGNIRIQVTEVGNGRVKIGVEAPRDVHIARAELLEQLPVEASYVADATNLHELLQNRSRNVEIARPR